MTQNSARTMVKIYSPSGEEITTNRLNALDLTRSNGYTWNVNGDRNEKTTEPAQEPAQEADTEVEEDDDASADEGESEDDEPAKEPAQTIDDEAKNIADYDNVEAYLKTFEPEALRTMLEEKFGEKTHPRTGQPKLIEKYIELSDLMDADADDTE